jgi:hypothetical protein
LNVHDYVLALRCECRNSRFVLRAYIMIGFLSIAVEHGFIYNKTSGEARFRFG